MARYTRTAGAKEAKTSPSRSKSRASKPQLTKPKLGQGKRGLRESEMVRQGLMKGMKEFPHWAKPATKSRAAKGTIYGGMGRAAGDTSMGGRGRGGRGLPESEQVRSTLVKTIDRLTGQINKMEQEAKDPKNVKKIQSRKSSRKVA